ncbi:hypothetical protein P421_12890 [Heyndrickxia coagulans P38]|jgi:threonine aldolase|uniref:Uncharacterized protein n=2 Tax=Bacillaceae TaxID=186817 RepID=A0A133KPW5_HEYCO|nr:hypothetical protein P421_12890 [Heyndrickxia coagulans P38]KWZ81430.1 hypothetical protein HMPREF3213_02034 [Heyndrickxia coagulans]
MTMPLENRRKWMRRIETEALLLPEKKRMSSGANDRGVSLYNLIELGKKKGLPLFPWLPDIVRIVVHRNISEEQVEQAARIIKDVYASFKRSALYV